MFPHCPILIQNQIAYLAVLPDDLPSTGLPVHVRADVSLADEAIRFALIDLPGWGLQVDREAEEELRDALRVFIFVTDEASRGIVAEILPRWS